jgi:hypothetical protein
VDVPACAFFIPIVGRILCSLHCRLQQRPIAGLQILHIINEPTAAAISYGLDKKSKTDPVSSSMTSEVAHSTFLFSRSMMVSLGSWLLLVIPTLVVRISITVIVYFVKQYEKKTGTDVDT